MKKSIFIVPFALALSSMLASISHANDFVSVDDSMVSVDNLDFTAAPADRCEPVMATVIPNGRDVTLKYNKEEFDRQYKQLASQSGGRVPSPEQVQAQVREIAQQKMMQVFPNGGTSSNLTITLSCRFTPRIHCKLTIEL